jgi:hypothetical protein
MGDIYPNTGASRKAYNNFNRVVENVRIAQENGVSATEIDEYLKSEGFDRARFLRAYDDAQAAGGKVSEAGFGSTFANSLLFNFGDEALARFNAMRGEGTYEQNLAAYNLALGEYSRQDPGKAFTAEALGVVAPMVATLGATALPRAGVAATSTAARMAAPAARELPLITRMGSAAKVGAASGAVSGAGASRPGERIGGAAVGGLTGLVAGPGTVVLLDKAGKPALRWLGGKIMSFVPGAQARAATAQENAVAQAAMDKFNAELNAAGFKPDEAFNLLRQAEAAGAPRPQLADVIEQLQFLRTEAARTSGKAGLESAQALTERQKLAPEILTQKLSDEAGVPRVNTLLAQEANKQDALRNIGPIYDAIRQRGAFQSNELSSMFKERDVLKRALDETKTALTTEDYAFQSNIDTSVFSPKELLSVANKLNTYAGEALKAGDKEAYAAAKNALEKLNSVTQRNVPGWETAGRQWAEEAAVRDAYEFGRGFLNATDEDAFKAMQDLAKFGSPRANKAFKASIIADYEASLLRGSPSADPLARGIGRQLNDLQLRRLQQGLGKDLTDFQRLNTEIAKQDLSKTQLQQGRLGKPEVYDANTRQGGLLIPTTPGEAKDVILGGVRDMLTEAQRIQQNKLTQLEAQKLTEMFNRAGTSDTVKLIRDLKLAEKGRVGGLDQQLLSTRAKGVTGGTFLPTLLQQKPTLTPENIQLLEEQDRLLAEEEARLTGLLNPDAPPANEKATDAGNVYGRPPGMSDKEWNAILKKRGLLN